VGGLSMPTVINFKRMPPAKRGFLFTGGSTQMTDFGRSGIRIPVIIFRIYFYAFYAEEH
jgi:hypothetical protein